MKVYFAINNNKIIVNLPYVEDEAMDFSLPAREIEEVGIRSVMGNLSKAEASLSFDYPAHKKKKGKTANQFIKFVQDCINKKKLVRVVAVRNNGWTFFNRLCVITELSKKLPKRNGDVPVTIKFKER